MVVLVCVCFGFPILVTRHVEFPCFATDARSLSTSCRVLTKSEA